MGTGLVGGANENLMVALNLPKSAAEKKAEALMVLLDEAKTIMDQIAPNDLSKLYDAIAKAEGRA